MRSWKLGRFFGIDLYLHWTFWLLILWFAIDAYKKGGTESMFFVCTSIVAIFGCLTLHEFGHALMARRFGIRTLDVTLYPLGGVARLERMSEKPFEEICIAIAGPAVNFAIASALLPLSLILTGITGENPAGAGIALSFMLYLGIANLVLLGFNLLPAFPMDGGRVLRALLVKPLGRLKATEIAAGLGAVFALWFVYLAFTADWYLGLLVAAFVFLAGQQELAFVRFRTRNREAPALYALPIEDEILTAVPVDFDPTFSGLLWDPRVQAWVLWQNGKPIHTYPVSS